MNHGNYQESLKNKSIDQLLFIAKDASEAMNANQDNPNNGYYADEIHYAVAELKRKDTTRMSEYKSYILEDRSRIIDWVKSYLNTVGVLPPIPVITACFPGTTPYQASLARESVK